MPWTFREETGYFSFCPLTSFSFPSLHPLFPPLKPFLPPLTNTLSFLPYLSLTLSLTTPLSTQHQALTSLITPTQFSRFLILFLVSVRSLPSSELLFVPLHAVSACHYSDCTLEDAFGMAPHNVVLPSLTLCSGNIVENNLKCTHNTVY